jgi:hypothetical protein
MARVAANWGVIARTPEVTMLSGERHRERVLTPVEQEDRMTAAIHLEKGYSVRELTEDEANRLK